MLEKHDSDFWFNNLEHLNDVDHYGENYYAYKIYKHIVTKLQNLPEGYIVVMGTNNCISFDLLCQHFGYDRCIGYDIANPKNHPRVIVKNVLELTDLDNIPIAFVHNDIGNFQLTPVAKLYAQRWAANNVVKGGYFLGRTNRNYINYNLEGLMENRNFINYNLSSAAAFLETGNLTWNELYFHMLSKRL